LLLLHDNAPAYKAAFANFLPQRMLQPFIINPPPPRHSPEVSPPDYFLFSKFKIKLKGLQFAEVAEIQEAVTDELKKVQKEEFSAAFQKLYDRAKACCILLMDLISNKKSLRFLKENQPQNFWTALCIN
jgi:hypothetical protein